MLQKGVFDFLENMNLKNLSEGKSPDPHFLPHLFHDSPSLPNAIVGLCASIFRGVSLLLRLIGEFISVPEL